MAPPTSMTKKRPYDQVNDEVRPINSWPQENEEFCNEVRPINSWFQYDEEFSRAVSPSPQPEQLMITKAERRMMMTYGRIDDSATEEDDYDEEGEILRRDKIPVGIAVMDPKPKRIVVATFDRTGQFVYQAIPFDANWKEIEVTMNHDKRLDIPTPLMWMDIKKYIKISLKSTGVSMDLMTDDSLKKYVWKRLEETGQTSGWGWTSYDEAESLGWLRRTYEGIQKINQLAQANPHNFVNAYPREFSKRETVMMADQAYTTFKKAANKLEFRYQAFKTLLNEKLPSTPWEIDPDAIKSEEIDIEKLHRKPILKLSKEIYCFAAERFFSSVTATTAELMIALLDIRKAPAKEWTTTGNWDDDVLKVLGIRKSDAKMQIL